MVKQILVEVISGDFDQGFQVKLRIGDRDHPDYHEETVQLPAAPELPVLYGQWQQTYEQWGVTRRLTVPPQNPKSTPPPTLDDLNTQRDRCNQAADQLRDRFVEWLDSRPMLPLRDAIILLNPEDPARLVLQTQNPLLQKLPWQTWGLLSKRPQLEWMLGAGFKPSTAQFHGPLRILAVLGDDRKLDLTKDWNELEKLPNAEVHKLVQPSRKEFSDTLCDRSWDILFFAGHSAAGRIYLNADQDFKGGPESLSLEEIGHIVRQAIDNGLHLAIFNSCDGLDLARQLAEMQLPRTIVMREPVPDPVAQAFLRYFLDEFSKGAALHFAVRKARQRLQTLEAEYPCATWLPILCQHPGLPDLRYPPSPPSPPPSRWDLKRGAIAATLLLVGLVGVGWAVNRRMNPPGQTGASLERLSPQEQRTRISAGERILLLNVKSSEVRELQKAEKSLDAQTKEASLENQMKGIQAFKQGKYTEATQWFDQALQHNPNDPEVVIYRNNAQIAAQGGPKLKIAASLPIGSNPAIAQEMLRGIAQAQQKLNDSKSTPIKLSAPLWIEIANDDNDPKVVQRIARHYINQTDILAVIGSNASDASVAGARIYNEGKLVMISPTSFADQLANDGPYSVRMVPSIHLLARPLVNYELKQNPQAKLAFCFHSGASDNESFTRQFVNEFRDHIKGNDQSSQATANVVDEVSCDFSQPNFNPQSLVNTMLARGVTSVLLAPHVDHISQALSLAQAAKGRLQLLSSPTLYTGLTLEQGEAMNGLTLPVPWWENAIEGSTFPEEARQRWGGRVNWRSAYSYDAVQVLAAGLRQSPNREGLVQMLQDPAFRFQGVTGEIKFFLPSGDRQMVPGIGDLMQVQPSTTSRYGVDFIPLKPQRLTAP